MEEIMGKVKQSINRRQHYLDDLYIFMNGERRMYIMIEVSPGTTLRVFPGNLALYCTAEQNFITDLQGRGS